MNGTLIGLLIFFGLIILSAFTYNSKHQVLRLTSELIRILLPLLLIYIAVMIFWSWLSAPDSPWIKLFLIVPVLFLVWMFGAEPVEYIREKFHLW